MGLLAVVRWDSEEHGVKQVSVFIPEILCRSRIQHSLRTLPTFASAHTFCASRNNLVPRAQRQDTELWNNPFQESKILGLQVSRRMRALALKRRPEVKSMWIRSTTAFNEHSHRLFL